MPHDVRSFFFIFVDMICSNADFRIAVEGIVEEVVEIVHDAVERNPIYHVIEELNDYQIQLLNVIMEIETNGTKVIKRRKQFISVHKICTGKKVELIQEKFLQTC